MYFVGLVDGLGILRHPLQQNAQTAKLLNGIRILLYVIVKDVELTGRLGDPILQNAPIANQLTGIKI